MLFLLFRLLLQCLPVAPGNANSSTPPEVDSASCSLPSMARLVSRGLQYTVAGSGDDHGTASIDWKQQLRTGQLKPDDAELQQDQEEHGEADRETAETISRCSMKTMTQTEILSLLRRLLERQQRLLQLRQQHLARAWIQRHYVNVELLSQSLRNPSALEVWCLDAKTKVEVYSCCLLFFLFCIVLQLVHVLCVLKMSL